MPKKRHSVVKFTPDILRRAYILLAYLKDGSYFPTQIAKRLGVKRETLAYLVRKLEGEGLIYCTNPKSNKFKQYKLTPTGEKVYAGYESTVLANQIAKGRITTENSRFKCLIRNHEKFLPFIQHPFYNFIRRNNELKNCIVYHGKIEDVNVTIIHGARHISQITMVMTSPKFYAHTGKEAIYIMYKTMVEFQNFIDKQWNLHLSPIEVDSEHLELAWESPYAKAMMTKTRGSPITTPMFKINQSPPSLRPKEEWHDPEELDRHLLLPDIVDQLRKDVSTIDENYKQLNSKVDIISNAVISLVESTRIIANSTRETQTQLTILATKLTELVSVSQSKIGQGQGKTEEKPSPLSKEAEKMFG